MKLKTSVWAMRSVHGLMLMVFMVIMAISCIEFFPDGDSEGPRNYARNNVLDSISSWTVTEEGHVWSVEEPELAKEVEEELERRGFITGRWVGKAHSGEIRLESSEKITIVIDSSITPLVPQYRNRRVTARYRQIRISFLRGDKQLAQEMVKADTNFHWAVRDIVEAIERVAGHRETND